MALFRKLVFSVFVLLYLVLCPMMILYSLGYVWAPGAQRGLVKTGLLSIASAPPGASIYVGKRHYTKTTPAILREFLPGQYQIKVALKGYRPWTRLVPVEPERATVLERILLLPEQFRPKRLLLEPFEQLIPLPGGHQFLLVGLPPARLVTIFDWRTERAWTLPLSRLAVGDGAITVLATVKDSSTVLLRLEGTDRVRWLWLELRGKESRLEDLTDWWPRRLAWAAWDPSARHELLLFHDRMVSHLGLGSGIMTRGLVNHVRGFGIAHKKLYVLTEKQIVERMDLQGRNQELFLDDRALNEALSEEPGLLRLTVLSNELLVFLGKRGQLMTSWPPYRQAARGVVDLDYDAEHERLLVWGRERVGALNVPGEIHWLFSDGRRIEQALWVHEGSHILIRDADRVRLLEADSSDTPHVEDLLRVKEGSAVAYSEETGKVYYLDHPNGMLSAIQLVPTLEPLTLPFAEP